MRPRGPEAFLASLEFHPVTREIARYAGELYRQWRQDGITLALPDLTIAAVAIKNELHTGNRWAEGFPYERTSHGFTGSCEPGRWYSRIMTDLSHRATKTIRSTIRCVRGLPMQARRLVKLLFDEHLSRKPMARLSELYPGSDSCGGVQFTPSVLIQRNRGCLLRQAASSSSLQTLIVSDPFSAWGKLTFRC